MNSAGKSVLYPDLPETALPVKITVIVFWGMVLVGMLAAYPLLLGLEQNAALKYSANADHIAHEIDHLLEGKPVIPQKQLEPELARLINETGVSGIVLESNGTTARYGNTANHLTTSTRNVGHRTGGGSLSTQAMRLTIFQPSTAQTIAIQRRHILVSIGVALLVFGLGLQWVLKKVLTQPFQRMMSIAQDITSGNVDRRFDESRTDEFGFLARFINRALDVTWQQTEVRTTLDRARASELTLAKAKERVEVTLDSINNAVITTNENGVIDYMNPVAEALTLLAQNDTKGMAFRDAIKLIDEATRRTIENPIESCLRDNQSTESMDHVLLVRQDKQEIDIAYTAAPIHDKHGVLIGAVMVMHDVSHGRLMARELTYQASHDELTGLDNRREFERQLRLAVASAKFDQRSHAMCYLDLDQFKIVNDTCGHFAGDELLRQFTVLLQQHTRDTDLIARLGGDEFGILLKYCSMENATRLATTLIGKVRDFRFKWEEHNFDIGVSIGLVAVTDQSKDVAEILSAADMACYAAKDAGRNRIRVHAANDDVLLRRQGEMQWVSRLGKALEENRFRLYCQPIVEVNGPHSDPAHYEILLRLEDEDGKIIAPGAFIPAAERYNMMPQIDQWVIRSTFNLLRNQPDDGRRKKVAINLSGQSLCEDNFLHFVIHQLDASGVSPEDICFEITETAAIANLNRALHFISILRGMGCVFSLDDFGSGLSSFNYLKHLKVDYLKLDGNFVKEMLNNPIDRALVEATNQIGHAVGIKTIAEFVENQEILATLRTIGVDYAQGYGIAKPCPVEDVFMGLCKQVSNG